jgi:hypothetical protein
MFWSLVKLFTVERVSPAPRGCYLGVLLIARRKGDWHDALRFFCTHAFAPAALSGVTQLAGGHLNPRLVGWFPVFSLINCGYCSQRSVATRRTTGQKKPSCCLAPRN